MRRGKPTRLRLAGVLVLLLAVALGALNWRARHAAPPSAISSSIGHSGEGTAQPPVPDGGLAAALERIAQERQALPQRGTRARRHHAVAVTAAAGQGAPAPSRHDYAQDGFRLVDYRQCEYFPPVVEAPDGCRYFSREWLYADGEDGAVILVHELYRQTDDGALECCGEADFAADRVVAQVPPRHSLLDFQQRAAVAGLTVSEVLLVDANGDSLLVLETPQATLDAVAEARSALEATGMCNFVEVDAVMRPCRVSGDSLAERQWWHDGIDAKEAWETTVGSQDVLVGVVDTGVLFTHPDLQPNMWCDEEGNYGVCTYDGGLDTEVNSIRDRDGHGTHVAGIIGAVGDNQIGVAGVNWKVQIVNVNYTRRGSTTSYGFATDSVAGFEFCRELGCRIINFSSGDLVGGWGMDEECLRTFSAGAEALRQSGVILVCAAGNEENDNDQRACYPADCPGENVISVAAVDRMDCLAYFSNYGPDSVDIAAPGVDVFSTYIGYSFLERLIGLLDDRVEEDDAYYCSMDGTSMATPVVSGVLALMQAANPELDWHGLVGRLYDSADCLSSLDGLVAQGRRVNVGRAVKPPLEPPEAPQASQGTSRYQVEITWRPAPSAQYYRVWCDEAGDDGSPVPISEWQEECRFIHAAAVPGVRYHYRLQCAMRSDGGGASAVGEPAMGWLKETSNWQDDGYLVATSAEIAGACVKITPSLADDGECLWLMLADGGDGLVRPSVCMGMDGEARMLFAGAAAAWDAGSLECWKLAANHDFTRFALLCDRMDVFGVTENPAAGVIVLDRRGDVLWSTVIAEGENAALPDNCGLFFAGADSSLLLYGDGLGVRKYASDGSGYNIIYPGAICGRMAYAEDSGEAFLVFALPDGSRGIAALSMSGGQVFDTGLRFPEYLGDPLLCATADGNAILYRKSADEVELAVRQEGQPWRITTIAAGEVLALSLAADGAFALWQTKDDAGGFAIWLYDVEAGRTALVAKPMQDAVPVLAPDGYSMAYLAAAPEGWQLLQTSALGNSCLLKMSPGWNLVGFPFTPDEAGRQAIAEQGGLRTWAAGRFQQPQTEVVCGMAGWVRSASAGTLRVKGHLAPAGVVPQPGWNLLPAWMLREQEALDGYGNDAPFAFLNDDGCYARPDADIAVHDGAWIHIPVPAADD